MYENWVDYRFIWTPTSYYFFVKPSIVDEYTLVIYASNSYTICRAPLFLEFESLTLPYHYTFFGFQQGGYTSGSKGCVAKFKNLKIYQNTEFEEFIYDYNE